MLSQITVTIGDDKILIESLPATPALQLLTKTIRIVGGVGNGISDFPSNRAEFEKLSVEFEKNMHLGKMIEGLIDRLDSDALPKLIKGIVRDSLPMYRDGKGPGEQTFDEWYENRFSKDLPGLFALLVEIYKFNFGEPMVWVVDFFKASRNNILPEMKQAPDSGSPPPS